MTITAGAFPSRCLEADWGTVQIKIEETGELKVLENIDGQTGENLAEHFVLSSDEFFSSCGLEAEVFFDEDSGAYTMSKETYDYWNELFQVSMKMYERLDNLAELYGRETVLGTLFEAEERGLLPLSDYAQAVHELFNDFEASQRKKTGQDIESITSNKYAAPKNVLHHEAPAAVKTTENPIQEKEVRKQVSTKELVGKATKAAASKNMSRRQKQGPTNARAAYNNAGALR